MDHEENPVCLGKVDLSGSHGSVRAYNIDNKEEYIDFKITVEESGLISKMKINEENVYMYGYEFFRDFHGVIRYSKVVPIENRFELLDL